MNPISLHRLTVAGVTVGAAALIVSCTATGPTGPVEHGKVIDKRSKAPRTEMVTEDVYNCRATTTRAARSGLVTGKGGGGKGGGKKGGKSDGGDSGLVGSLFGGGSDSKPAKKPGGNGADTRPSAKPQSPSPQPRRDCTKVGERKVPKLHPGRYELHIKAEDGRTAWKRVTVDVYNRTKKGDAV
ncbi:hypothetical protein [Streptomyces virginiae]|uniref:hypothetical protein n=1 Tax=Streptomyces virginiae TaxID=1961 RepID=UPI00225B7CB5|nr:hypothetical protein [Streptomyces virginiae]MCX5278021.1 hypothetical protein [Streptomyces virginiae]